MLLGFFGWFWSIILLTLGVQAASEFRVWGSGLKVSRFRVQGFQFRFESSVRAVEVTGIPASGFRVEALKNSNDNSSIPKKIM